MAKTKKTTVATSSRVRPKLGSSGKTSVRATSKPAGRAAVKKVAKAIAPKAKPVATAKAVKKLTKKIAKPSVAKKAVKAVKAAQKVGKKAAQKVSKVIPPKTPRTPAKKAVKKAVKKVVKKVLKKVLKKAVKKPSPRRVQKKPEVFIPQPRLRKVTTAKRGVPKESPHQTVGLQRYAETLRHALETKQPAGPQLELLLRPEYREGGRVSKDAERLRGIARKVH